jgi:hypothetical protein
MGNFIRRKMKYKFLNKVNVDYVVYCDSVSSSGNWLLFWDESGKLVHACSSDFIQFVTMQHEEE